MIRRVIALFGAAAVALLLVAPAASAQYVNPADVTNPPAVDDAGGQSSGTGAGTLPRTGSDSIDALWRVAVVLVAAGGLLVLTARKRAARAHRRDQAMMRALRRDQAARDQAARALHSEQTA